MRHLFIVLLMACSQVSADSQFESQAEALHNQGQYQKAIDLLAKDADRLSPKGYLTLAASYSELKEFESEVRILKILSTKDPKNYQWHMLIGQSHLKRSRHSKEKEVKKLEETLAVQTFRDTIKANPKFKPAYDQLLEIFTEKKENHEARELLMEALRQFGDRGPWLNQLCHLQANDGFLAQAEETCTRAIRVSPKFPDNYVFLAQSLIDQNEMAKAQKAARLSGERFPKSEFVQWGAGTVYLLVKNFEAAIKYFTRAIEADPKSARSHLGLGEALFESGNRVKALEHYKKACQFGAKNGEKLHVRSAETRMKGDSSLGLKYRSAAETCD